MERQVQVCLEEPRQVEGEVLSLQFNTVGIPVTLVILADFNNGRCFVSGKSLGWDGRSDFLQ